MYGAELRYNDLRYNDSPGLTMGMSLTERKIFPAGYIYNDLITEMLI